jgi:hypothetical protein
MNPISVTAVEESFHEIRDDKSYLWENSPQLQRFEAFQYEPPGQKEMGMPNLPQNLCGKGSLHS